MRLFASISLLIAGGVLGVTAACGGATVPAADATDATDGDAGKDPCDRPTTLDGLPCCKGTPGQEPGTTCNICPVPTCAGCPGDEPGRTCYPPQRDGGSYGRCIEDGKHIEAKIIGAYCCNRSDNPDGPERGSTIGSVIPVDGGCVQEAPPSLFVAAQPVWPT